MCFNLERQESGNYVSRNFANIAINSHEWCLIVSELLANKVYLRHPAKSSTEFFVNSFIIDVAS